MDNQLEERQVNHTLAKMYRFLLRERPLKKLRYRKIGVDGSNVLLCMEGMNMMGVLDHMNKLRVQGIKGQASIKQIVRLNLPNEVVCNFIKKLKHIIDKYTYSQKTRCFVVFDGKTLDKTLDKKKSKLKWKKANPEDWCCFLNQTQIKEWKNNQFDRRFAQMDKEERTRLNYSYTHYSKQLQRNNQYWAVYNQVVSTIMYILENAHIFVIRAPYEADAQLIKLHRQNYIDCVISYDHGFINYEIPFIYARHLDKDVFFIDFNKQNPDQIDNPLLRKWVEETQSDRYYSQAQNKRRLLKRMAFEVLRGSKYIERFEALSLPDIMRGILSCEEIEEDLASFFKLIRKFGSIEIPKGYEDDAFEVMLILLYQTCASKKNGKELQYLDQQYDQLVNTRFIDMYQFPTLAIKSELLQVFKDLFTLKNQQAKDLETAITQSTNESMINNQGQHLQGNLSNQNSISLQIQSNQDSEESSSELSSDEDIQVDLSQYEFKSWAQQAYRHVAHKHLCTLVGAHFYYDAQHYFGIKDVHNNRKRGKKPQLILQDHFKKRFKHIKKNKTWIEQKDIIQHYQQYLKEPAYMQSTKKEQRSQVQMEPPQVPKGRIIVPPKGKFIPRR